MNREEKVGPGPDMTALPEPGGTAVKWVEPFRGALARDAAVIGADGGANESDPGCSAIEIDVGPPRRRRAIRGRRPARQRSALRQVRRQAQEDCLERDNPSRRLANWGGYFAVDLTQIFSEGENNPW